MNMREWLNREANKMYDRKYWFKELKEKIRRWFKND